MTTQAQWVELQKAFGAQLGNDTYSKVAMMPQGEVEQVLKDTNTKNNTDSTDAAQAWIDKLSSPYKEYAGMNTQATQQFQQAVAPQEEEARKSSQYYQSLVQKGPMFELAMRPELAKISPTFMGANRRDLDAKLTAEGITDPVQKQSMIDSYLQYADKSMTMSLSSLGQLYDSAVIAARTASEDKQAMYEKVADIYKEAYSTTIMANKDWLESKINPKKDEESVIDIRNRQEALVGLISQVSSYGSREKAIADLEKNKTAAILKVGEEGYNQIIAEIDRIYPESGTTETKPSTNIVSKIMQTEQARKPNLLNAIPAVNAFNTAKSFMTSLFGQ